MPDLLCMGEPLLEFNQQPDGRYLEGFGGDTSNCAIAAARQGATGGVLAQLGTDRFGQKILDYWAEDNIDISAVTSVGDAPTGIYFVTHSGDGHDFTYRRNGSAASLMSRSDLARPTFSPALSSCLFLHQAGFNQEIDDREQIDCFAP